MSQYIVIPRLDVRNANAQPAWWMIGPPPVTAYLGFAHALARAIGVDNHDGIAIIHHDIQFLGEQYGSFLHPHQFRAASFIDKDDYSSKNAHVLSSQPTVRCHLNISVVIRFEDKSVFGISDAIPFLRRGRIAGGTIIDHGKPDYSPATGEISDVAKAVGSGFSIVNRQDLMVKTEIDRDMLDVLLRLTRPGANKTEGHNWILPTSLGYVEISTCRQRRNVRGDFPHAYAEPLVGLIQYQSIRDAGLHFWRYQRPTPNTFIASTQ